MTSPAARLLFALLLAALVAACSDTPPSTVKLDDRSCATDDDCTRRELCVEGVCTAMGGGEEPDASPGDEDASAGDPDAAVEPDAAADAETPEPDADLTCGEPCPEGEVCRDGQCYCEEGATRACGSKVGECRYGVSFCAQGVWGECLGGVQPSDERCDSRDNDCDARVDEGVGRELYADVDGDGFGDPDVTFMACFPEAGQSEEAGDCDDANDAIRPDAAEVCDGIDNDCDEVIDEGCPCVVGSVEPCGLDVGTCVQGTHTCAPEGWGACEGSVEPAEEACNGLDDDCDGETDEEACAPPEAICPEPLVLSVGEAGALVGSGSDPDGGEVTWVWEVSSSPEGAGALTEVDEDGGWTLTPDQVGGWTLRFCVMDDEGEATCCEVPAEVEDPCVPLDSPGVITCPTSWDRRPVLEFAPLPEGVRYVFNDATSGALIGEATQPGQNYLRPAAPIGPGGPLPGAEVTLQARACLAEHPSCCSAPEEVAVALVESCDTPVAPTAENIIISEYLINGDNGSGTQGPTFEAGEAVEITNLSNCPITLEGVHLRYCSSAACTTIRYMNFGPDDIIPPRGVFVSIRAPQASTCGFDFLPPTDNSNIFGIRRSSLELVPAGSATDNNGGWFGNNGTTGSLRLAQGAYATPRGGQTIIEVEPYLSGQRDCESVGFDALGACGETPAASIPTEELGDNQLGRLWHPCDAVEEPNPPGCFE